MLDNIFKPLFDVSLDPSVDPKLHMFLCQVGPALPLPLRRTQLSAARRLWASTVLTTRACGK